MPHKINKLIHKPYMRRLLAPILKYNLQGGMEKLSNQIHAKEQPFLLKRQGSLKKARRVNVFVLAKRVAE